MDSAHKDEVINKLLVSFRTFDLTSFRPIKRLGFKELTTFLSNMFHTKNLVSLFLVAVSFVNNLLHFFSPVGLFTPQYTKIEPYDTFILSYSCGLQLLYAFSHLS